MRRLIIPGLLVLATAGECWFIGAPILSLYGWGIYFLIKFLTA